MDDDCGLEFLLFVYSSLCLSLGPEKRNGMMSMVVVYDSSYSLNLFSRPFFGVLITVTVKPNVSSIIGPRFGRGVGNCGGLTSEKMHKRRHTGEKCHNEMVSQ